MHGFCGQRSFPEPLILIGMLRKDFKKPAVRFQWRNSPFCTRWFTFNPLTEQRQLIHLDFVTQRYRVPNQTLVNKLYTLPFSNGISSANRLHRVSRNNYLRNKIFCEWLLLKRIPYFTKGLYQLHCKIVP